MIDDELLDSWLADKAMPEWAVRALVRELRAARTVAVEAKEFALYSPALTAALGVLEGTQNVQVWSEGTEELLEQMFPRPVSSVPPILQAHSHVWRVHGLRTHSFSMFVRATSEAEALGHARQRLSVDFPPSSVTVSQPTDTLKLTKRYPD